MSLNKVMLIGNIGVISETKETEKGLKYINFSLATNKRVKANDGQYESKTEWHNVAAFGKLAENIGQFCKVGSKLYIEGEIQSGKYKDKEGIEKTSYKIMCNNFDLLSSGKDKESEPVKESSPKNTDFIDDDIPF